MAGRSESTVEFEGISFSWILRIIPFTQLGIMSASILLVRPRLGLALSACLCPSDDT